MGAQPVWSRSTAAGRAITVCQRRTVIGVEGQNGIRTGAMANAAALGSLSLFLLSARSADRKKNLHFCRRGGVQSGLLKEPCLSSLLLSFARRLEGCSLGSLRCRLLRGFSRHRLASDPLAFRDPDVAGCDDLQSSLYSLQPSGIIRSGPERAQFEPSSRCWQHLNGL